MCKPKIKPLLRSIKTITRASCICAGFTGAAEAQEEPPHRELFFVNHGRFEQIKLDTGDVDLLMTADGQTIISSPPTGSILIFSQGMQDLTGLNNVRGIAVNSQGTVLATAVEGESEVQLFIMHPGSGQWQWNNTISTDSPPYRLAFNYDDSYLLVMRRNSNQLTVIHLQPHSTNVVSQASDGLIPHEAVPGRGSSIVSMNTDDAFFISHVNGKTLFKVSPEKNSTQTLVENLCQNTTCPGSPGAMVVTQDDQYLVSASWPTDPENSLCFLNLNDRSGTQCLNLNDIEGLSSKKLVSLSAAPGYGNDPGAVYGVTASERHVNNSIYTFAFSEHEQRWTFYSQQVIGQGGEFDAIAVNLLYGNRVAAVGEEVLTQLYASVAPQFTQGNYSFQVNETDLLDGDDFVGNLTVTDLNLQPSVLTLSLDASGDGDESFLFWDGEELFLNTTEWQKGMIQYEWNLTATASNQFNQSHSAPVQLIIIPEPVPESSVTPEPSLMPSPTDNIETAPVLSTVQIVSIAVSGFALVTTVVCASVCLLKKGWNKIAGKPRTRRPYDTYYEEGLDILSLKSGSFPNPIFGGKGSQISIWPDGKAISVAAEVHGDITGQLEEAVVANDPDKSSEMEVELEVES